MWKKTKNIYIYETERKSAVWRAFFLSEGRRSGLVILILFPENFGDFLRKLASHIGQIQRRFSCGCGDFRSSGESTGRREGLSGGRILSRAGLLDGRIPGRICLFNRSIPGRIGLFNRSILGRIGLSGRGVSV